MTDDPRDKRFYQLQKKDLPQLIARGSEIQDRAVAEENAILEIVSAKL